MNDRVAVVTGASRGIGAAMVRKLKEAGYRVAACSRSLGSLGAIPADHRFACDVSDVTQVKAGIAGTLRALGRIDAVDARVRAFVEVVRESALSEADASDARRRAGQVRALCVFDKERIAYGAKVRDTQSWHDIPTCKEQGLDVQYLMLRAIFLPGKVTPEQQAFYVDLFQKVVQTPEYKEYMEKQALKPIFLTGKDMLQFLEEDDALNKSLMMEAGFVAK